jgi:hypothetical protein
MLHIPVMIDVEDPIGGILPKTGLATSTIAGDDGNLQAGWNKATRFVEKTINGITVVLDYATSLMWIKSTIASEGSSARPFSWANAFAFLSAFNTILSSPAVIIITGTCSPDITGLYQTYMTINGKQAYTNGTYCIWFRPAGTILASDSWVITAMPGNGDDTSVNNGFNITSASGVEGIYGTIMGQSPTGSPVVSKALNAGFSDWKIPNVLELFSIANYGAGAAPFIYSAFSLISGTYLSSTRLSANIQRVVFSGSYPATSNGTAASGVNLAFCRRF